MKTKRECFALLVSIFLVIFLSGIVAAVDDCAVVARNQCSSPNTIVAGLSSDTNAHAQKATDGNYGYVLCCNFAGATTCSASNKIFGISSTTNAHVSAPYGTGAYSSAVCYADLVCRTETTASCSTEYPIRTVSIFADTNSHVAKDDFYTKRICCKHAGPPPVPGTVFWADNSNTEITQTMEATTVRLFFNSDQLANGQEITYEIFENDLIGDDLILSSSYFVNSSDVTRGFAYDLWVAEYMDDALGNPEYFFVADIGTETLTSADLDVSQLPPGVLDLTCEPHNTYADWVYLLDGIEDSRRRVDIDDCYNSNYDEECCPNELTCNRDTDQCEGTIIPTVDYCSDYENQTSCEDYDDDVADASVALLYNGKNCDSGNNILNSDPLTYLTNCQCTWETGSSGTEVCKGDATIVVEEDPENPRYVGSCASEENTNDNCDDGFLQYSWKATWTWHSSNPGLSSVPGDEDATDWVQDTDGWHYDPTGESAACVDGGRNVPCAGGLKVPFFTAINFIIAIAILIAFYIFIETRKR